MLVSDACILICKCKLLATAWRFTSLYDLGLQT